MPKRPKVSVITITFNHEKFIKQALESIVKQKTNFDFEVIIADDCSTDDTQNIVKEYAKKYPNIVKPILREKNIGAQLNFKDAIQKAQGEYIALCEGDDYWIDLTKLQIQSDFLDSNSKYSLVFHPVEVTFENGESESMVYPAQNESDNFTFKKLLNENFIQTNSVMYRRQDYTNLPSDILPLDWYLHLYHAQFGEIGFIDEVMSVYRRHGGGLWWDSYDNQSAIWKKYGVNYLGLFVEILKLCEKKPLEYQNIVYPSIIDMFNRLLQVDRENATETVMIAAAKYPRAAKFFIEKQNESIQRINTLNNEREAATYRLSIDLSRAMEEIQQVKTSKSFLLGYYISHPWNAPRFILERVKVNTYKMKVFLKNRRDLIESEGGYREMRARLASYRNKDQKKIAVVLHLYYPDLWGYFSEKLALLDKPAFDLFVSLPVGKEEFEQEIKKTYPDACVVVAPNRGRDVLPFLIIAKSIRKKGYDSVLKMHSKKSKHRKDGSTWLSSIVDNLLPENPGVVRLVIETLNESETGLIGPEGEYVSLPVNYEANKTNIRRLLKELKSSRIKEKVDSYRFDYGFFAGTMFWVRLDAIESILAKNASAALFDTEAGQIDNTYAHAVERMLCLIPELDDKKIYSVSAHGVRQIEYSSGLIPEWSDVYVGQASQKK